MKPRSLEPGPLKSPVMPFALFLGVLAATHLPGGRAMAEELCAPEFLQCEVVKGHVQITVIPDLGCTCENFVVMRDDRVEIPVLRPPTFFKDPEPCEGHHTYAAACRSKEGTSEAVSCTVSCPCKIEGLTCTPEPPGRIRARWDATPQGCCEKILVFLECDGVGKSSVTLPGSQTEVIIDGCASPFGIEKVCVTCIAPDDTLSEATCSYLPGVPGTPVFLRGDANADGAVDISDAIAILGFLFLGTPNSLPCKVAADTNDSEGVDLSDSVFLLNYLFLGTAALVQPFPDCGIDPTPDALGCDSYTCG
jgi:hypothetical protein